MEKQQLYITRHSVLKMAKILNYSGLQDINSDNYIEPTDEEKDKYAKVINIIRGLYFSSEKQLIASQYDDNLYLCHCDLINQDLVLIIVRKDFTLKTVLTYDHFCGNFQTHVRKGRDRRLSRHKNKLDKENKDLIEKKERDWKKKQKKRKVRRKEKFNVKKFY